jgi:hypothetical protein
VDFPFSNLLPYDVVAPLTSLKPGKKTSFEIGKLKNDIRNWKVELEIKINS